MAAKLTAADIDQRLIADNRPITLLWLGKNVLDNQSLWRCLVCGYEWRSQASYILSERCAGCKSCSGKVPHTVEHVEQKLIADNRPITLLWLGKNSQDGKSRWGCDICGEVWNNRSSSVVVRGQGCRACAGTKPHTVKSIGKRLIADNRPMSLLRLGVGRGALSDWECHDCGHIWPANVQNVLLRKSGCPMCKGGVPYTEEAIKQKLITDNRPATLLVYGKNTHDNQSKWGCDDCGNVWKTSVHCVFMGCGCPSCTKCGYDSSKPAYFYLHTYNDFIKIGITNYLNQRHDQLNNQTINGILYTIEDTMSWDFENGSDAFTVESMVLKAFKDRQHTDLLETSFDGRTELLNISVYDEIVELLNEVTAAKGTRMPSIIP